MREPLIAVSLTMGLLALGAGCGGSSAKGGSPLTCAYLASGDNCWKTTANAATSCLPDPSETGTLSADGKTCTYASGNVVTFTPPLVLPLPTSGTLTWNFTVTTASGATCLALQDVGKGGITLTVQGKTVKQTATVTDASGPTIDLTCPDGTTYTNANGVNLADCVGDAGYLALPSEIWLSSGMTVSFSLASTGPSSSSEPVFNCQTTP